MVAIISRNRPVRCLRIESWHRHSGCRARTSSRSLRYSHACLLKWLGLWSPKWRGRRDADWPVTQDTADIVPLQHLEAIADHARLQDGIRVGIDRVLHRQTLQGP